MTRVDLLRSVISNIENGVFVEIGTHIGNYANEIVSIRNDSVLYCIDPYIHYDDYKDGLNNSVGDKTYEETKKMLTTKYGEHRVKFIRKFSENAVNDIPDNIDFLYIDGNHQYKYVKKDLELYFPKVKNGGIIIGDDAVDTNESLRNEEGDIYFNWNGSDSYGNYGVIKAFREFLEDKNVKLSFLQGNQYFVMKQ